MENTKCCEKCFYTKNDLIHCLNISDCPCHSKIDLKKAGKDFAKRFTGVMSRLATEDTNTLREEQNLFKEWLNSGATNFPEDGYDWWVNKFNQKLEEIEQEIGELETIKGSITNGFKIVVLQIIKNKKS